MRGWQTVGHGGPEQLVWREDLADPAPGPGEVRVRVAAAGLNNTDIWSREGAYGTPEDPHARAGWRRVPLDFPRIQGGDIAGTIDAVGDGIDHDLGTRVIVNSVVYGSDPDSGGLRDCRLIGSELDGGFAEYVVVPADNAFAVAGPLSDAELACLPIAFLTAEHMLERAGLGAGEDLLVTGASGGVGSALVLLGLARGAQVTALAGADKCDAVRQLGAGVVIARERFADIGARALPGGPESQDVVADVVAGEAIGPLVNALRYGGRYVTAGAIAGPVVTLDLRTVYLNQLSLYGSTLGSRADFARLVERAHEGAIRPPVAAEYALADLPAAQAHFARKDFVGNIVVTP